MKKINLDKNILLSLGGAVLYGAGMVLKSIGDKKNEDAKLAALVDEAVKAKLENK